MRNIVFDIVIMCLLYAVGMCVGSQIVSEQAIEHGAAQHNPQTGEFEWVK